MLALQFSIAGNSYAIVADHVHQVIPVLPTRPISGTPAGVLGVFHLHGRPVPAVDLSVLMGHEPSRSALSSRFIVVNYPFAADGALLAILAEGVTNVIDAPDDAWQDSGLSSPALPFLGPVATINGQVVQRVELEELLPEKIREVLFQ